MSTSTDVLLVEDSPGDVRLIQDAFAMADNGVALQIATEGKDAIELLSHRQKGNERWMGFVLLDLNLSSVDGIDVLEAIGEDPALSHLPVLVLTSSTENEDVLQCYAKSANAYLTKPDSPDELISLRLPSRRFESSA